MKQLLRKLIWQAKKCSDLEDGTLLCLINGDGDYGSITVVLFTAVLNNGSATLRW